MIELFNPNTEDQIPDSEHEEIKNHENSLTLYLNFPPHAGGLVCVTSVFRIGRDPAFSSMAETLSSFAKVSKRHAEIELIDGTFYLTDFNSTNGTFIDGQRLNPGERMALTNLSKLMFSSFLVVTAVLT